MIGRARGHALLMTTTLVLCISSSSPFIFASFELEEFLVGTNSTTVEDEVCQMEVFEGACPGGHVMLVRSAMLGRIRLGKCVSETFGFLGCYTDVLAEMEMYCSGRSTCSVRIDDQSFKRGMPCHRELKNHLWIKYTCVPVVMPTAGCEPIHVTTSGFLSSHVTHTVGHGCGGIERPWRLEADDGLQINLTMIDFAYTISKMVVEEAKKRNLSKASSPSLYPESCRVYAIIREPPSSGDDPGGLELSRSATICGWSDRIANVFLSSRNRLEIRLSRAHAPPPPSAGVFPLLLPSQKTQHKLVKRHDRVKGIKEQGQRHQQRTERPRQRQTVIQRPLNQRSQPDENFRRLFKRSLQQEQLLQEQQRHLLQKRLQRAVAPSSSSASVLRVNASLQQLFQYTTQPYAEFLFYFSVTGCANPVLGEGMWMRRNRNLLVIGCNEGMPYDTWTLTCMGSTWQGNYGDCSVSGVLSMTDNVNISSTAIFILGIAVLVSIVILIAGVLCIRRIRPSSSHCQVRCLRDHYADATTSGGYGTASTTPSCNKLHVTGSCPSDYGGSGNDYARMRLQQRFNNYPGDYSSMASLMTYEPTRAPTFQTNLASGSIQPLNYGIVEEGPGNFHQDGMPQSPQSAHHAIIDANRLRQLKGEGRGGSGMFGRSCGNLGTGNALQKSAFVAAAAGGSGVCSNGSNHQKSVSEPYPLFDGQASPQVMEHIYESPDTLLLKRKEATTSEAYGGVTSGGGGCSSLGSTKNVSFVVGDSGFKQPRVAAAAGAFENSAKVPQTKSVGRSINQNSMEDKNGQENKSV